MKVLSINNFTQQYNAKKETQKCSNYPNLAPLKFDTVSFGAMKKAQFKGIDHFVVEKFKAPIEKFNLANDLQAWAKKSIEVLKSKDFGGRCQETKTQRKAMIKEWVDYITKGNSAYTPAIGLLILSAITSDLGEKDNNIPPVLNKGVLADTVSDTEKMLTNNPKAQLNFSKMYKNKLRSFYMEDTKTGETETKWIIIPSKKNDPENFEANVEKLKTLSHKNWCTKSFNAEPYLAEGDFHVYLENGQPKLGVRFEDEEIVEIQGEKNDTNIPVKYLELVKKYNKDNNFILSEDAKDQVFDAEKMKKQINAIKKDLGDSINLNTIEDAEKVLNYLGLEAKRDENKDGLIISEYKQINYDLTFTDLDIDENKFFNYITEINGYADFFDTQVTNLNRLEKIKGNACFTNSQVKSLGNLKIIEGSAIFKESIITTLENLIEIGEEADFSYSKIQDLGSLEKIGSCATFSNSKIINLGNLKVIGDNADFSGSLIEDLSKLEKIEGDAYFQFSKLKSLGNLKKIGGNAYFNGAEIDNLGKLNEIEGDAYFQFSKLKSLSNLKRIGGKAVFYGSKIINLGKLKVIGDDADFYNSKVNDLGNLEEIGGNANFRKSKIKNLGKIKKYGKYRCHKYMYVNKGEKKLFEEELKKRNLTGTVIVG